MAMEIGAAIGCLVVIVILGLVLWLDNRDEEW
jgi:hypothetical protein